MVLGVNKNTITQIKGETYLKKQYNSFEAYVKDVFYNDFYEKLNKHIIQNKDKMQLSSILISYVSHVELEDFTIVRVSFRESDNENITFTATVRTEIRISGKTRQDYDYDLVCSWFSVSCTAVLKNGLHDLSIYNISEYSQVKHSSEGALTKHLIPYISSEDLDTHAKKFLNKYCPQALYAPMPLPISDILQKVNLKALFAPLSDKVFGQIIFRKTYCDIYEDINSRKVVSTEVLPGTILINPDAVFLSNIGSFNNTIIHECIHWDKHYNFFELQKLLDTEIHVLSCATVENYSSNDSQLNHELAWMEWQANSLAPRILIPESTGRDKFNEILLRLKETRESSTRDGVIMEKAIKEFASFFQVSIIAAKIRVMELGFDQAAGAYNYVDGRRISSFSFREGTLKKGQTFTISRANTVFLSIYNRDIIENVRSGRFIHAGGMFVINHPKYVNSKEGSEAVLTDYALEHADECCLIFDYKTRARTQYDDSFYNICYLCRGVDSESFLEAKYNPDSGNNEDVQKRAEELQIISREMERISKIMNEVPSTFCGTLDYHINRRRYTNEKMEEYTGISSRMIQDYRKKPNIKITLPSLLALCIGLNLHPTFAYDLISKAGYNIMANTNENIAYRYLIDHQHTGNIQLWNEILKGFGINQQLPRNGKDNW